jgi:hypothetical protein
MELRGEWLEWVIGGGFLVIVLLALWTSFGDDVAALLGAAH